MPFDAERQAEKMRWPGEAERVGESGAMAHKESHSDPSHHVGPCDEACRRGIRAHIHENPRTVIGKLAAYRSSRLTRDIREARGLPPEIGEGYVE